MPESFWNTESFFYDIFQYFKTKNSWRKIVITPSDAWQISITDFFETQKGSPTNFCVLWDRKFSTEHRDTHHLPPPPLIHEAFDARSFSETQKGSERTKKNQQRIVIPLSLQCRKIFDTRKILIHRRVPRNFFSELWSKRLLTTNRDIPSLLHLLSIKFFDTRNFLKHERFSGTVRRKGFLTEELDTPPLCMKYFVTRTFLKHGRVPLQIFLVLWDNLFWLDIMILPPPPPPNPPPIQKYFHWKLSDTQVFQYCETKNFWRKIVTAASI